MTKDGSHIADAHAVLLPAFADPQLDEPLRQFLRSGGRALLLGESRQEYVGRKMAPDRLARETPEMMRAFTREARQLSGSLIVAIDQEPTGIQRLQGFVQTMSSTDIQSAAATVAKVAQSLGINFFLAPILDVVTGHTTWLANRTLGDDASEVARIGAAFIIGVQSAGVAATAKHFPGYPDMAIDPAIGIARQSGTMEALQAGLGPFRSAIASGVYAIMTGPAVVEAFDPVHSASTSPATMQFLRDRLAFDGVIVSDDLDAPSVMLGESLAETAIRSLNAGADLLLLASGPHLPSVVEAIVAAAAGGRMPAGRLSEAAGRVRALAERLG